MRFFACIETSMIPGAPRGLLSLSQRQELPNIVKDSKRAISAIRPDAENQAQSEEQPRWNPLRIIDFFHQGLTKPYKDDKM